MVSRMWSILLSPDAPSVITPARTITLMNACLSHDVNDCMGRTTVVVDYRDDKGRRSMTSLCTLICGQIEQALLSVGLQEGQEYTLRLHGANMIFLTGSIYERDENLSSNSKAHLYNQQSYSDAEEEEESQTSPAQSSIRIKSAGKSSQLVKIANSTAKQPQQILSPSGSPAPSSQNAPKTGDVTHSRSSVELLPNTTYCDIKKGDGEVPVRRNHIVSIRYIAKLGSGEGKIYEKMTLDPFICTVGDDALPCGFNEGVLGMTSGGQRRIFIPAHLGYGKQGTLQVPPNTDLVIDCELISIS